MHLPTLIAGCDPPDEVRDLVTELIARKAVTRELGSAPLPPAIERFVDSEFALAEESLPPRPERLGGELNAAAETFFRTWVERLGSTRESRNAKGAEVRDPGRGWSAE